MLIFNSDITSDVSDMLSYTCVLICMLVIWLTSVFFFKKNNDMTKDTTYICIYIVVLRLIITYPVHNFICVLVKYYR